MRPAEDYTLPGQIFLPLPNAKVKINFLVVFSIRVNFFVIYHYINAMFRGVPNFMQDILLDSALAQAADFSFCFSILKGYLVKAQGHQGWADGLKVKANLRANFPLWI